MATEHAEHRGGWSELSFYTQVTIAGLLIFVLVLTGVSILAIIGGRVAVVEDAVQGIVSYALAVIPTIVVVVLAWRGRTQPLPAAIWALLVLFITAPMLPNALGTLNSFFVAAPANQRFWQSVK